MFGVILTLGKNNGFANQRAGFILNTVINEIFQNHLIRAFTKNLAANVFALNGGITRDFFA